MIGQTLSHYKILEKLGEGGMGVVYKAQDVRLDRFVALKFLPSRLTANEAEKARFLQEAKAASALNHPNVCTIYGIDEFEGQQFIEMEHVDGVTLKQRLPIQKESDALAYAVQIGEALQEAHSKGIVHRDVKAENIMVNSKNQIKVMDFGLAKLKGSLKLTRTSSTVGTLAYMAPEQIQGGEVDARSDIFSFGALLFEMLTGSLPFRGEHEAAMMYSIINELPESLSKLRPDASPELERIIHRAIEKDPEDRYQSAADFVSELRRVQKQSSRVSREMLAHMEKPQSGSVSTPPSVATQPAAAKKPNRFLLFGGIAVVVVLAAAAVAYFTLFKQAKTIDSLVVLPFVNAGGDPQLDYLSDGISEGIINSLTRIHELRVIPRSTAFRFKGKDVDPQEVGNKLNVGAVLSGTVKKAGDNLDIQVDLIDIQRQSQIWGDHFTANSAGVLSLQDEIIDKVSKELQLSISGETKQEVTKRYTQNGEAYQLYLQGRFYWNKRTAVAIDRAINYLNQAIALDSTFALAYAGLADCYVIQPQYAGVSTRISDPLARAAAEHALRIDNSLAEAHTALAFILFDEFKYDDAEKEFNVAISLNPRYPTTYHWYGIMLSRLGHYDRYLSVIEQAQANDPYSPVITMNVGIAHWFLGQNEEALRFAKKSIELDPSFAVGYEWTGSIYLSMKNYTDALPQMQKAVELSGRSGECLATLGNFYGITGNHVEAVKLLQECEARYHAGTGSAYNVARIYAGMGEKEKALEWLETDYNDRSTWITSILADYAWNDIRSEPRFIALEKKVGLVK